MERIDFNDNQCVLIENEEQYKLYYPEMRSAQSGMTYEGWVEKFGELDFPFYLQNSYSVNRGHSIGRISKPLNVFTDEPLEVLSFNKQVNN